MADSIGAALSYLNGKLDAAYKAAAKSSVLDVNPAFVRAADIAGTFYLPTLSMVGLGDVTAGVMPDGDVTQTWNSYTYTYDRGRKIEVEVVAKDEGARVAAIANAASEYMRMHVVPELDAIRFAKIADGAAAAHKVQAALSSTDNAIAALNVGLKALQDDEVDTNNLLCFWTPNMENLVMQAASTAAHCRVLDYCKPVTVAPGRFSTAVTLNAGGTSSAGGFTASGDAINFILMDKAAAFADAKHIAEKFILAEVNQSGDLDRWDYRVVHDCWVYTNKTNGIYVHSEDTVS